MVEAGYSLPWAVHARPVPDLFQKLTRSLGTSDLCISLKDHHVLCFVSKASGQRGVLTLGFQPQMPHGCRAQKPGLQTHLVSI